MPIALVIGASRGLGLELAKNLHSKNFQVFATMRSPERHIRKDLKQAGAELSDEINIVPSIDLAQEDAGERIVTYLKSELGLGVGEEKQLDLVIMNAGVFKSDTLEEPNFENLLEMYKVVSIAPFMVASHLVRSSLLAKPSKFILITSEGGSIALRTKEEGAGNYGHHSSKAAANMVGKLLANDLMDKEITVGMIHPGFMKTDMTKGVGYDKFYESGGAVEASEAAETTVEFILNELPHRLTGSFWAPRGPRDIGQAERVLVPIMGKDLSTPLPLPW